MFMYKDRESTATRYSGFASIPASFKGDTDVCFSFSFNDGSPPIITYNDEASTDTRYSGFASIPASSMVVLMFVLFQFQ